MLFLYKLFTPPYYRGIIVSEVISMMKKATISLSESTLEYIDSEAARIGTNRSSMITFMVEQYRSQKDNLEAMSSIQQMMEDLKKESQKSKA